MLSRMRYRTSGSLARRAVLPAVTHLVPLRTENPACDRTRADSRRWGRPGDARPAAISQAAPVAAESERRRRSLHVRLPGSLRRSARAVDLLPDACGGGVKRGRWRWRWRLTACNTGIRREYSLLQVRERKILLARIRHVLQDVQCERASILADRPVSRNLRF